MQTISVIVDDASVSPEIEETFLKIRKSAKSTVYTNFFSSMGCFI
tara:strand:- start:1323 stop:1457 length:135 start_codon:yes stop_codon:yes gene_type:complete